VKEHTEKGYKCILSDNQTAIKVLHNIYINSKLVWDCHQTIVELAKRNRVQLAQLPGHAGIDGNEIAGQLAREGSSPLLTGPESALGICEGYRRNDQGTG
jgi:ribonuclease HI